MFLCSCWLKVADVLLTREPVGAFSLSMDTGEWSFVHSTRLRFSCFYGMADTLHPAPPEWTGVCEFVQKVTDLSGLPKLIAQQGPVSTCWGSSTIGWAPGAVRCPPRNLPSRLLLSGWGLFLWKVFLGCGQVASTPDSWGWSLGGRHSCGWFGACPAYRLHIGPVLEWSAVEKWSSSPGASLW